MDLMPWMQQQGMLPAAGETVLCAVSGGRDSVCLLHYLASLGRRRGFAVAAAHYNHLMRPTAGRDEAFVAGLCRELSVPLYVERGDVRAIARQEGWGVEEAGRRLRYDFLERTADAIGASRIATAHHLSDQAETVVLNLLRGTGPEGLAGIPPVAGTADPPPAPDPLGRRSRHISRPTGWVMWRTRPTTAWTSPATACDRRCGPCWHSSTPAPERSISAEPPLSCGGRMFFWIGWPAPIWRQPYPIARQPVSPMPRRSLAAGTPLHPALHRLPARCRRSRQSRISPQNVHARAIFRLISHRHPPPYRCPEAVLRSAPEELRPRMLRLLLERLPVGKKDVSAAHIEALLTLREGGMLDLPEGVTAWREKDVLHLEMTPPSPPAPDPVRGGAGLGGLSRPGVEKRKNTPPPDGEGLSKTGRFSDHILTLSDGGKMSEWTLRCPQRGRRSDPAGGKRPPQRQTSSDGAGDAAPAAANHPGGVYKRRTRRRIRRGNGSEIFAGKRRQQYKYFDDRERSGGRK